MEDPPFTEDNVSSGKRKRSPGNLVGVSIPILSHNGPISRPGSPPSLELAQGHPLPKRPRLPTKPPVTFKDPPGIQDLPSNILRHIVSYVDPRCLARLVCVNQRFRSLLDQRCDSSIDRNGPDVSPIPSQESVWSSSRRHYIPTMPKPMVGVFEPTSFALAFGLDCQFCGKHCSFPTPTTADLWQAGPGVHGVRTIWPFKVRSCAGCLGQRLQKVGYNTSSTSFAI